LQELNLEGTLTTNVGLKWLCNLDRLEVLVSPDISDDGVQYIADIPKLRHLTLSGAVTTKGLKHLRSIPNLESFALYGTAVDDDSVALFAAIPSLQYVAFLGAQCTPTVIAKLRRDRPELRIHLLDSPDSTEIRKAMRFRRPKTGEK